MRWPWQPKPEARQSASGYTDALIQLAASQASATIADASSTAAIEAAAGALSRAFASAEVVGEAWTQESITPATLARMGRDLVRTGETLHAIRMGQMGRVHLVPCSTWYFEGGVDPNDWTATATAYGPSGSVTWRLPMAAVIFCAWGSSTARPYHGMAPTSWASTTARLQSEVERSLADEAGGPLAHLLAIPQDGGDDDDESDPLAKLKADIGKARGKALLVETTAAAWGDGQAAAPHRDWRPSRLGPAAPEAQVTLADQAFARMLAACGCSPALFDDSDGTSKREALRQWHLGTVLPLARQLEHELTAKLETSIKLRFDSYPLDLAGRAQAFQKLVAGGVAVNEALATSGLIAGDEA